MTRAPMTTTAVPAEPRGLLAWWHRQRGLRRMLRRPMPVFGLAVVLAFVVVAVAAPWVAPYDPARTDFGSLRQPPSDAYRLGTDEIGRDVLSRVVHGARASLQAGVISVLIAMLLGVPLGLVAGYYGGLLDEVIGRFTDAMLAFPFLILAVALAAALGPSLTNAMIAIGIASAPTFVRLTRGQVLAVRAEDYVQAAVALGARDVRLLTRHVLPNAFAPILVQATLTIAGAIIAESALSFLGLGVQPPTPSWGGMLNVAKNFLVQAPWMAIWPGLSIFVTVLAFNLFGDGLRDALDPRDAA
jgi:ABC-type dipeptide/oligopeptide/nickel transport system permease subunit